MSCFHCNGTEYLDRETGDAATDEQIAKAETLPNGELEECPYCEPDE